MIKRGWQSLNKTECFATDARNFQKYKLKDCVTYGVDKKME